MKIVSGYAVTAEVFFSRDKVPNNLIGEKIMEMEDIGPYPCSVVWLVLRGLMLLADKQDKDLRGSLCLYFYRYSCLLVGALR